MSEKAELVAEHRSSLRSSVSVYFDLDGSETPAVCVITNHIHEIIGGRGTITSGGKAVAYLSQTRMRVGAEKKDDRWVITGRMSKLRFRGSSDADEFKVVVVPGEGVHRGLSAVADAIHYGLANEDRVITLAGEILRIHEQAGREQKRSRTVRAVSCGIGGA